MRVNIYSEELTDDVEWTSKVDHDGVTWYGVRQWLPEDGAVTWWVRDKDSEQFAKLSRLFAGLEFARQEAESRSNRAHV